MEVIYTDEENLKISTQLIENNNFKFDYKILDESYINDIVEFINKNYLDRDDVTSIVYTQELIKYYLHDAIPIFFYTKKNSEKPIALIIGKFTHMNAFNHNYNSIDGNFFCIIPQLRKLKLPKLFKSTLIIESIKKYNHIDLSHYTTNYEINVTPICKKTYVNRCINFDQFKKLGMVDDKNKQILYKRMYEKYVYPESFKELIISDKINIDQIDDITNKLNSYNKQHFDIYENITSDHIIQLNKYDVFIKFVITDTNNNICAFIVFYRLDTLLKSENTIINTLYLHYYFVQDNNILDYLEYVGEYLKNNNICDLFISQLFTDTKPPRYTEVDGNLYYHFMNIKPFDIKEQKIRLALI